MIGRNSKQIRLCHIFLDAYKIVFESYKIHVFDDYRSLSPGSAKINYFTLDSMEKKIIGGSCLKSQELCRSSA
jgi:hypothetical protein